MKTPQKLIEEAMKIENFLKDETIGGCIKAVAAKIYDEFRAADTSEKRVLAWARSKALEELLTEFKITQEAGEVEVMKIAQEAKRKQPQPKRSK